MEQNQEITIYKYTNRINGREYIGRTCDLETRKSQHKHATNRYVSAIDDDILIYGIESFDIEVLEKCSKDVSVEREKYWIKHYKTFEGDGYNLNKGAGRGKKLREPKNMKPATQVKCKQALEMVYKKSLTYNQACEQMRLSTSTFKTFRDSEIGKQLDDALKKRYLSNHDPNADLIAEKDDYVLELLDPRPDWIWVDGNGKWLCTDPPRDMIGKTIELTVQVRTVKKGEPKW